MVTFQRYLLNPPMKAAVWLGLVAGHVLVEPTGRKTGKRRRTVVGCHVDGTTVWVVAEQGRHAGYVRNLAANPDVRLRLHRRWRHAVGSVADTEDPDARLDADFDPKHAALMRRYGTDLLTVRFDLQR